MNTLKIIKPRNYINLLIDVYNFLIAPTPKEASNLSKYERNLNTIMLFLINIVLSIVVVFSTKFILSFFEINTHNIGISKAMELYSSLELLIIVSVIIPLMEEVGFRLFLKIKPIYIALSTLVLTYYFITKIIFHTYNTDLNNSFMVRLSIAIIIGIIAYYISFRNQEELKSFWIKHFQGILYFSILAFGFVHILNYELSYKVILLAPIITLSQLISGTIYSYIRTKYGFIYNFAIHSLNNLLSISIILLIKMI